MSEQGGENIMDFIVMTPGEKLRLFRRKYNLRQDDLAGKNMTRNTISMIETNKISLTPSTAEAILTNFHNACLQKNKTCTLSLNELLNSAQSQARALALQFISSLQADNTLISLSFKNGNYANMLLLLEEHNLPLEKALLYDTIGSYYMRHHDYTEAYTYYSQAFNSVPKQSYSDTFANLTSHLIQCCYKTERFLPLVNYCLIFFHYDHLPNIDLIFELKYNMILAYYHLEYYEKALQELNTSMLLLSDNLSLHSDKPTRLLLLKIYCLKAFHRYDDALNSYQQILKFYDLSLELQIFATFPIIHIYLEQNELNDGLDLFHHCLSLISTYEKVSYKQYIDRMYKELTTLYHKFPTSYRHSISIPSLFEHG